MDTFEKLMYVYGKICVENDEPKAQPGISAFAVKLAFECLDLPLNPVLERLYRWHNGIWHLNAFLSFLPLGEAVKTYRAYADASACSWMNIRPSWFPVFDQNGDYQFCLDLAGSELWKVDLEDGSISLLAPDYEVFLDAIVSAFEREIVYFDHELGSWDIEDDAWRGLCAEFGLNTERE